jgi:hypothetical protein
MALDLLRPATAVIFNPVSASNDAFKAPISVPDGTQRIVLHLDACPPYPSIQGSLRELVLVIVGTSKGERGERVLEHVAKLVSQLAHVAITIVGLEQIFRRRTSTRQLAAVLQQPFVANLQAQHPRLEVRTFVEHWSTLTHAQCMAQMIRTQVS